MISSSKEENVNEAVQKLKEFGIDASGTICDVSNREDAINLVKALMGTSLTFKCFWKLIHKMIHNSVESCAEDGLFSESWTVALLEIVAFQNIFSLDTKEKKDLWKNFLIFSFKFLIDM